MDSIRKWWALALRVSQQWRGRATAGITVAIAVVLIGGGIAFAGQSSNVGSTIAAPVRALFSNGEDQQSAPNNSTDSSGKPEGTTTTSESTTTTTLVPTTVTTIGPNGETIVIPTPPVQQADPNGGVATPSPPPADSGGGSAGLIPIDPGTTTSSTTTTTMPPPPPSNGPASPFINASAGGTMPEDPNVSVTLTAGDDDGYVTRVVVDWNDDSSPTVYSYGLDQCNLPGSSSHDETAGHTYQEAGTYNVAISVISTDCDGGSAQEATSTVSLTSGGVSSNDTASLPGL